MNINPLWLSKSNNNHLPTVGPAGGKSMSKREMGNVSGVREEEVPILFVSLKRQKSKFVCVYFHHCAPNLMAVYS